jgi:phosphate transport system substrate-binding protein
VRSVPAAVAPDYSGQEAMLPAAAVIPVQPVIVPFRHSSSVLAGTQLSAAGATLPAPVYQKWFQEFHATDPRITISYRAEGSGGGISQLTKGAIDFAASDIPMKDAQFSAPSVSVLHFPATLGGVAIVTNLPGVDSLNLTGEVIANIFLGHIERWDDPAIARWNPGVALPSAAIVAIHRSDACATTFVLSDYLSKVTSEFKTHVGTDTKVSWPSGPAAAANDGVAAMMKEAPYSIGYLDISYAFQNRITVSSVRNRSGVFILPSLDSLTAAASAAADRSPSDFRASLVNAPGKDAYPLASYTWLLAPERFGQPERGHAMREFLSWMLVAGQAVAPSFGYAPLPSKVVALEQQQIKLVR